MIYSLPVMMEGGQIPVPNHQRAVFSWPTRAVSTCEEGLLLKWKADSVPTGSARFRLTAAVDTREEKVIELRLGTSNRLIGQLDLRFAYALQPFESILSKEVVMEVMREGLRLCLGKGELPLWIVTVGDDQKDSQVPEALCAHLLFDPPDDSRLEALLDQTASFASVQPFGWMEGCVLDGLMDLAESTGDERYRTAVEDHLSLFIHEERLIYENPRSEPADDRIYGIEGMLPFAGICKLDPDESLIELLLDSLHLFTNEEEWILDGKTLSAEGCYTIAYPLAVIAARKKRTKLAQLSLNQLLCRINNLWYNDELYLRYYLDDPSNRTFRLWSRAYAWYMLGIVRTAEELRTFITAEELGKLQNAYSNAYRSAERYRNAKGLWNSFLDDPESETETSGSAGIAASVAIAARLGWVEQDIALQWADQALHSIEAYITPDGFLQGVSQSNRGGEPLQRSGYRVISQMGMGLVLQLKAARDKLAGLGG